MVLVASMPMARAEDFPARPVKIIVQTAAGSSLDVMARLIAEPLSQIWGQQAIIVNQAGAGGLIAARATAASAPDGYTLFLAGGSVFVVLPVVQNNLPFDVNEFVPIGFVAEQPYTLLTPNKLGVNSVAELVALSKKQPGGLDSVAGTRGGLQHLTVEWFRNRSGANLNMIHYPGAAQASRTFSPGAGRKSSQAIAVLGLLGAYVTPVSLSTGEDHPWILFSYTFLVNLGGLAAARYRRWKTAEWVAFAATVILYFGWAAAWLKIDNRPVATVFLIAFYAQFASAQTRAVWWAAQLLGAAGAVIWEEYQPGLMIGFGIALGGLAVAVQEDD
jgi:hypothetical protein